MNYLVRIHKWIQNGFTLCYYNNKPFFIYGAIPGEEIQFQILKENKNFGFGITTKVIQKSDLRIDNDCPIFLKCGGCNFRHIAYNQEAEIKVNLLSELKGIKDIILNKKYDLFLSPPNFYRNQVKIHFDIHTKGFYKFFSNTIVPFPDEGCKNLSEAFNRAIQNIHSKQKEIKFYFIQNQLYYGDQNFHFLIKKERTWELSSNSFLQPNRFLIRVWLDWISNQIQNYSKNYSLKILELFCGTALISSYFLEKISYIEGYESNPISVEFAKKNLNTFRIPNKIVKKDLYKEPISISDDFDFIIINPPRKGLGRLLFRNFKNKTIPIVYSSCNPIAFNRDILLLREYGYKIQNLAIFDFFPRTYHLEIVAMLIK